MTYPLISEYVAAIQNAADNLDKLSGLKPVMDTHGEPVHSSGAFAVVFKMVDENGKYFALKCFTEEQTGRDVAYRLIAEELEGVESKYITSVRYYEKELFVDSNVSDETEFPVLLMDWIEGETMDVYIAENYRDNSAMEWLCYRFCKMAFWLRSQPFAHGDIKPDNIIVNEVGELTLIDYDGMFVPAMKGWKSPTLGTKDFVHPNRKVEDFNETIDDFTLASIALSLKAISLDSSLYDKFGAADRLLFSADNYLNLGKSETITAIQPLMSNTELLQLEALFKYALAAGNLSSVSFRTFMIRKPKQEPQDNLSFFPFRTLLISKPEKTQERQLTTEEIEALFCKVTKAELDSVDWDETGAKYSKDGKRLLKVRSNVFGKFVIRYGTKIICNNAFNRSPLTTIIIPTSVIFIGLGAFELCNRLTSISLPSGVANIGRSAFTDCNKLRSITIPSSVVSIGKKAFSNCYSLTSITIPSSVTCIGDDAFYNCSSLMSITIPSSTIEIGGSLFSCCGQLQKIDVHIDNIRYSSYTNSNAIIDTKTNCLISACKNTIIPSNVTSIGDWAFCGCSGFTSITIPSNVTNIGEGAFSNCYTLTSITIPSSVTSIGENAFWGCSSLTSITIPSSVTSIGNFAFEECDSLTSIAISSSVTSIGDCAFRDCKSLKSITIPPSVTSIGNGTFSGCYSLTSITIPSGVTSIGDRAFRNCKSLTSIIIPYSVTSIYKEAFYECKSLTSIIIPFRTKQHFMKMLPKELHDKLIESPVVK